MAIKPYFIEDQETENHNMEILFQISEKFPYEMKQLFLDLESLLDGCSINGKMEIVEDAADESDVEYGTHGIFTEMCVDQWSVGESGDSYGGFIYAKFGEKQWLKIPYEC